MLSTKHECPHNNRIGVLKCFKETFDSTYTFKIITIEEVSNILETRMMRQWSLISSF